MIIEIPLSLIASNDRIPTNYIQIEPVQTRLVWLKFSAVADLIKTKRFSITTFIAHKKILLFPLIVFSDVDII